MLVIWLLGGIEVRLDEEPVEIPSQPVQELLAYLLLNAGKSQHREMLAGVLWPESTQKNARNNLRHALWQLRKALRQTGQAYIQADDITIAFDVESDYWLDTAILEEERERWTADDLLQNLAVYRGELLPGFYDEWIELERERLQAIFERKMGLLLEHLVEEKRWPEVLAWGEKWIGMGHTPEPAYRVLMEAHAALGDHSSAAAVYQRCIKDLQDELGVMPSKQTQNLYEDISRADLTQHFPATGVVEEVQVPTFDRAPYKGLQYFTLADADLFFGRELLTAKLVSRIRQTLVEPGDQAMGRFLAVVGASGCGKSSIVRAGLLGALSQEHPLADGTLLPAGSRGWIKYVMTPTADPLTELATTLSRDDRSVISAADLRDDLIADPCCLHQYASKKIRNLGRSSRVGGDTGYKAYLLLVVDQFEELFTLCQSQSARKVFIDNLMTAALSDGPVIIVIALRADFYTQCGYFANLRTALEKQQVFIGPMNTQELCRAITMPAEKGQWSLEPGLSEFLIQEIGEEPGMLPLLSHTLLEMWHRRCNRTLTFAGYQQSGGLRLAIAQTADGTLQKLDAEQQTIARDIFLRLTQLGEGVHDTVRRAQMDEFFLSEEDRPAVEVVLWKLANARLITIGEGTVEIAHEVLIRAWPTLQKWVDENREALQLHRHLTAAAQAWLEMDRDPGELYRGTRLAQVTELVQMQALALSPLEQTFLQASHELARQQETTRESREQRELEAARKMTIAERRHARQQAKSYSYLRWLAAGLALMFLIVLTLAIYAIRQTELAKQKTRQASARELAATAVSNLNIDPERSVLLALEAVNQTFSVDQTVLPEAEEALHHALQLVRVIYSVPSTGGVAISLDGMQLATTDLDGKVKIRDTATGQEQLVLSGHHGNVIDLAFNQEGTRLVTTSTDMTAIIWDVATGEALVTLRGHNGVLISPAFSPDGTLVATTSRDGTARVWDASSGEEILNLQHTGPTSSPAFSPDGTMLAIAEHDEFSEHSIYEVRIWDVSQGKEVLRLRGHNHSVNEVDFGQNGTRLLTVSSDGTAKVWDAGTGEEILSLLHDGWVLSGDLSSDGSLIATGGADGTVRIWDSANGRELLFLAGHTGGIVDLVLSPDGNRLVTGSMDGTARLWDITPEGGKEWLTIAGHDDLVHGLRFSSDGSRIFSGSWDRTAKVWDATSGEALLELTGHIDKVTGVDVSPDGSRLATASYDGTARVWDAHTGAEYLVLRSEDHLLFDVVFSADGRRLVTVGSDNTAEVWDLSSGAKLMTLKGHMDRIYRITYSADGNRIATASYDGTARVWDGVTGETIMILDGHADNVVGVAFSPDGKLVATASFDTTVKIWDASTGELLHNLEGHKAAVWNVVFTPDCKRLISIGFDNLVKVWDLKALAAGDSTAEVLTFSGHALGPDIALSPDGNYLAVPTANGTVRVYVLPIEELISLAQDRLTRTWTSEECQRFLDLDQCPAMP